MDYLSCCLEVLADHSPITLADPESYEALWNVGNRLTLCEGCHSRRSRRVLLAGAAGGLAEGFQSFGCVHARGT